MCLLTNAFSGVALERYSTLLPKETTPGTCQWTKLNFIFVSKQVQNGTPYKENNDVARGFHWLSCGFHYVFCLFHMHFLVQPICCRWPEGIQSEKSSLAIMCRLLYQKVNLDTKCPCRAHWWSICRGAQKAIWHYCEKLPRRVPNHHQHGPY